MTCYLIIELKVILFIEYSLCWVDSICQLSNKTYFNTEKSKGVNSENYRLSL